jgi:hypothetical protein
MSTLSDEEYLDPNNPMSYAPRWMREEAKARAAGQAGVSDDSVSALTRSGTSLSSSPSSFDALLKEAVNRSLLDPEVMNTPPGHSQWAELFPVIGRFAAAIGVAAVVALFFVFMIPASKDHAQNSSASAVMEQPKTALDKPAPRESEAKPALAGFAAFVAANPPAQPTDPNATRGQSEALLDQFVQWQQKRDSTDVPAP